MDLNENITMYGICECGAVTLFTRENRCTGFSMPRRLLKQNGINLTKVGRKKNITSTLWESCNYCVNKWGIDLCGCGSGMKWGKCTLKLKDCKYPMQTVPTGEE